MEMERETTRDDNLTQRSTWRWNDIMNEKVSNTERMRSDLNTLIHKQTRKQTNKQTNNQPNKQTNTHRHQHTNKHPDFLKRGIHRGDLFCFCPFSVRELAEWLHANAPTQKQHPSRVSRRKLHDAQGQRLPVTRTTATEIS